MNNRRDKWTGKSFKVTIKLPENVPESIRRDKINRLYDILKPKNDNDFDTENDCNDNYSFSENTT